MSDRRSVRVLTTTGVQFLSGLNARQRSAVGSHWNAIRRYLGGGNEHDLAEFDDVELNGHVLETGINAVEYWAIRDETHFEDIYDEVV